MDTDRFDDLIRSLPLGSSRRAVLTALGSGLLAALPLAPFNEDAAAKKKRKKKKKKNKNNQNNNSPPVTPPPPSPVTFGCPGEINFYTSGSRRCAQSFTAPASGRLTSARCEISQVSGGEDFVLEIRTIDGTGQPTGTVLASAPIVNVPASYDSILTLTGTFNPPAPVQAGQGYAFVVTIAAGQSYHQMIRTGNPCPDQLFFEDANANGMYSLSAGYDMKFSATITV